MTLSFHLAVQLESIVQQVAGVLPEFAGVQWAPDVRPADPKFGDFQANGVLPLAKALKVNPRALASRLLEALAQHPFFKEAGIHLEIAGPGFINFRFAPSALQKWLEAYPDQAALGHAASKDLEGQTIVVDYSSPNTAKQMHVGHLRSMVIGEAIQRLVRFCGAHVVRDNHLGDWGTMFGILLLAIKEKGIRVEDLGDDAIEQLELLYKEGSQMTSQSPELMDRARLELLRLQQGDPVNMALWECINAQSYARFQAIYDLFNVQFDVVLGESFYRDKVDRVFEELKAAGIAVESQGALVVFHPEHPRFAEQPFIIRKSDGATNYASTDLATALYRLEHLGAARMINVTDGRQQDHFEQLALTVSKWFACKGYGPCTLTHAWFGTILGEDGKAIKTRSGENIKLKTLVAEGIEKAYLLVSVKHPDLDEVTRRHIAQVVAINAIRYADLSQNRTADYVFTWDKFLAFEGNTAPYLMYAVARIHSIFRKLEVPLDVKSTYKPFETEAELGLARKLILFPNVLSLAREHLMPHYICTYLYELTGLFSSFYNAEKVLDVDLDVRARRLALCRHTLETLKTGMHILGLQTLPMM